MKTLLTTIITALFISTSFIATQKVAAMNASVSDTTVVLTANEKEKLFLTFEKGILFGMDSGIQGVMESTLFNALNYKIVYPEFSSEAVIEKLNEAALEAPTHQLRFKAYLTLAYYKNQQEFVEPTGLTDLLEVRDKDKIFFYLQNEVQSGQITSIN
jgi:hypothetical protein